MSGCRSATSLPIAVGESLYHPSHFREYLQRGACSIVQVDVARIGGITPWLKTAHLAETFNVTVCPHFLMELHVGAVRRRAERALGRIHPAARRHHHQPHPHRGRPRHAVGQAGPRHRLGLGRRSRKWPARRQSWKIVRAGLTPLHLSRNRPVDRQFVFTPSACSRSYCSWRPAGARRGVVVQRLGGGEEGRLVGLTTCLPWPLNQSASVCSGLADLGGRASGGLLEDVLEGLPLLGVELVPESGRRSP